MKISELRIGNYINGLVGYADTVDVWELCKVLAIDSINISDHEIWVESGGTGETFLDFMPIPLTEEWLLKFGFELKTDVYFSNIKYKDKCWVNFSFCITVWRGGNLMYDWNGGNIQIQYVHQLQNLYFALTGKELFSKP